MVGHRDFGSNNIPPKGRKGGESKPGEKK